MSELTQADIDKLQKQITTLTDQLEAEAAKTQRAVDEAKVAKAEARKLKEIDPADLTKLEEENDRLKADLSKAQKEAKDAQKAAETATKALETETGINRKLVAENGLVSELTKLGITDPDYLDMATLKHIGNVTVVDDGAGGRKAMYGDKDLTAALGEWAATDAGKKVISAPGNNGGGAPGGRGGGGGKNPFAKESFNVTEQSKLFRENPELARQMASEAGVKLAPA